MCLSKGLSCVVLLLVVRGGGCILNVLYVSLSLLEFEEENQSFNVWVLTAI